MLFHWLWYRYHLDSGRDIDQIDWDLNCRGKLATEMLRDRIVYHSGYGCSFMLQHWMVKASPSNFFKGEFCSVVLLNLRRHPDPHDGIEVIPIFHILIDFNAYNLGRSLLYCHKIFMGIAFRYSLSYQTFLF